MAKKAAGTTTKSFMTQDSYQNFLSAVGRGAGNQSDAGHYGFSPISRNRLQLEWCYRSSWIAGRAVDAMAQDMTREGAEINSSDAPDKIKEFEKEMDRLQIWGGLCQTIKWARLYGGAVAFLMIDGQKPETPLRIETVGKGQFKGLLPMDRWTVIPSLTELVTEYGPDFGLPKFYDTVVDEAVGIPRMNIHYSRVIRLEGVELPRWQKVTESWWGQSVLERLWDRLTSYDSTTLGIAQLVYKAHLRTIKVQGLREAIAAGGPAMKGISKQIQQIRALQTNEGLTVLDGTDEFEAHAYQFGGLDAVLVQFGEQLCGALDTPAVRLFGQSPAGFNSGDTDLRNYYDQVKHVQVSTIGPGVEKVYRVGYLSTFGKEPPKVFDLNFKPLWQISAVEKSQIANAKTAAVTAAYESQIVKRSTALKELKQTGDDTGMWTNILPAEINEAESDPAPSPEALGLEIPKPVIGKPGEPNAGKEAKLKSVA